MSERIPSKPRVEVVHECLSEIAYQRPGILVFPPDNLTDLNMGSWALVHKSCKGGGKHQ